MQVIVDYFQLSQMKSCRKEPQKQWNIAHIIRLLACLADPIVSVVILHNMLGGELLNIYKCGREPHFFCVFGENKKSRFSLKIRILHCFTFLCCGATRNRTGDTRIFSPLLYQLSYGTKGVLCRFLQVVPPGIEPGTQGFSVLCSTN